MRAAVVTLSVVFVFFAVFAAAGQTTPVASTRSAVDSVRAADTVSHAQPLKTDTATAPGVSAPASPAQAPKAADSSKPSQLRDSSGAAIATPDSLRHAKLRDTLQRNEPKKIKLQKHKYGHHQVLLAVFMMIFVVGIVTLAQQWNPR